MSTDIKLAGPSDPTQAQGAVAAGAAFGGVAAQPLKPAVRWLGLSVPSFLLITGAAILGGYYAVVWAFPYLTLDPAVYGSRWSFAPWVFLHVLFGILALTVGPFQFWSGLRRRSASVHRWVGRTYLGAVGLSVLCAVILLVLREHSVNFRLGIAGLALAWSTTTGIAYVAIRRRLITEHREWMIRSYVVTFGFVLFRIILDVLGAYEIGTPQERVAVASWGCWAVPLLFTELVLQGRRVLAPRKRVRVAS